jgi:hypothetical protein
MTEPTTAAGRALLDWWRKHPEGGDGVGMRTAILAIEAEAATLDVERLARLQAFAEGVAASQNDTPGTRAAAKYALTGSLVGVVDEMRASAAVIAILDEPQP